MNILQINSSVRGNQSESTRVTNAVVAKLAAANPGATVTVRDLGANPHPVLDEAALGALFTPADQRTPEQAARVALDDALIAEAQAADVIVLGAPMYNFGMPAQFKAYIDNIARVGRTFGFDRSRAGEPYWPLLAGMDKRLVILSSRGDFGYGPGQRIAHLNHVEGGVATAFGYIGITDVASVAIEYDEFADDRLRASIAAAEADVDTLVTRMAVGVSPEVA